MVRYLFLIFCFCGFSVLVPPAAHSLEMGISLVVNDHMISDLQVRQRMKLIMASSGIPDTRENRQKLMPQIQSMLVDETLKLQAAESEEINVTPEEIEGGIASIAQQNNFSADQFKQILQSQGIPRSTLEDQVRSEIAWGKYVQKELRPQVNVSEQDIEAELDRLKDNPKFKDELPSRDQVLNKIGNERLGRLQARHLLDLKSGAFIESRG